MHVLRLLCVLLSLVISKNVSGAIELSCDLAKPSIQSDVTCVCKRTSGTGIDWYLNEHFHSNCYLSSVCLPQYSGYHYSINSTRKVFEITMTSYNYSDCTKVSCKDASDSSIERSMIPTSITFDTKYPTSLTEPAFNNKSGAISVTTGCISSFSEVKYNWYIIVNGSEEIYTPDPATVIDETDTSTCFNCNSDKNGKRTIGFNHREKPGFGTKTVFFRVSLYHASTNLILNLTTFKVYTVKDKIATIPKPDQKDGQYIIPVVTVLVVAVLVVIISVAVVAVYQYRKRLESKEGQTNAHYETLGSTSTSGTGINNQNNSAVTGSTDRSKNKNEKGTNELSLDTALVTGSDSVQENEKGKADTAETKDVNCGRPKPKNPRFDDQIGEDQGQVKETEMENLVIVSEHNSEISNTVVTCHKDEGYKNSQPEECTSSSKGKDIYEDEIVLYDQPDAKNY